MTSIVFTAEGADAQAEVNGKLTAGMVGVTVQFQLDRAWEGLNIIATFEGSGALISVPLLSYMEGAVPLNVQAYRVIDTDVPWEVLQKANTRLRIGLEGRLVDGTIVIPTVWARAGYIEAGALATGEEANQPTPGIYDQIMAAIEAGQLQGKPGDDGVSPTVSVTEIEGGHRVTITSKDGTESFDVMDGDSAAIEIVDDLYSRNPDAALSANMGAALREKIDTDLLGVQKELQAEIKQRVKTVNGVAPDENGNVNVEGGSGGGAVETDPTVPAWAKQPTKPTYTASEVGALPDSTVIPTVPSALKNPHALTFTGAVEATYDGSGPVSVVIPQPGSGGSGEPGADGFSPVATITQTGSGAVISITDKSGTTTATVFNGKDGRDGVDGLPGKDGADGKDGAQGPQGVQGEKGDTGAQGNPGKDGVSATHSWNGTTLTITSASGTSSANLKGEKGDKGDQGIQGIQGAKGDTGAAGSNGTNGTSVTVKSVRESTADGGSNVVTFSDGKTVTIKNGSKGSTGATGSQGPKGDKGDPGNDYVLTDGDKAEIAEMAGGEVVPDYWLSELEAKADAIQTAMETAGRNKSAFLWYTDAHWPMNSKMSPALLTYLAENTPMNKVNFGGDIVGDPNPHNHENTLYVYEWRKRIDGLPKHHSVYGNHDVNHRTTDVSKMAYAQLIAPEESSDMVVGGDSCYYIDNPSEKTRYLYLSYLTSSHTEMMAQGQFIVDALKSTTEGWHIVVIAHRWWQYGSSKTPTVGSVLTYEAEILSVLDAYNARTTREGSNYFYAQDFTTGCVGKVEFCIGGHIHVDYDFESAGGIPVIITAADTNQERAPDETEDSGTLGTTTESAVFGIIADYNDADNIKITVVGVGRGTSRIVRKSTVKPTSISDIAYSGDTTIGAAIDKAKFSFTVNYSNGSTEAVSGATSVNPTTIGVVGNNTVTITYAEGGTTLSGTVTIVGTAVPVINLFNKNDPDIVDTGRFNSSNNPIAFAEGQLITGYVEGAVGDTFTITTDKANNTNTYTGTIMCYDSTKKVINRISWQFTNNGDVTASDDYKTVSIHIPQSYDATTSYVGTAYVRFCVAYNDIDSIVITKA